MIEQCPWGIESLQNGHGPRPQSLIWGTSSRALSPLPIQVIRSDHILFVSRHHFPQCIIKLVVWTCMRLKKWVHQGTKTSSGRSPLRKDVRAVCLSRKSKWDKINVSERSSRAIMRTLENWIDILCSRSVWSFKVVSICFYSLSWNFKPFAAMRKKRNLCTHHSSPDHLESLLLMWKVGIFCEDIWEWRTCIVEDSCGKFCSNEWAWIQLVMGRRGFFPFLSSSVATQG